MVIAFEDIGVADPDLLVAVTQFCTDAGLRRENGGTEQVARALVMVMTDAVKDRSADGMTCAASRHPEWEPYREAAGLLCLVDRIGVATDADRPLAERVTATWYASGIEDGTERRVGPGDLRARVDRFVGSGIPEDVGSAVFAAVRATREPIVLTLLPLLQEGHSGRCNCEGAADESPNPGGVHGRSSGLRSHAQAVRDQRLIGSIIYALKPPLREYRAFPMSRDRLETVWVQRKRLMRPGDASKVARALVGVEIDQLCVEGGVGAGLTAEIAAAARRQLQQDERQLR